MQIQPYLFFEGRAEDAARFYQRVLGAETEMLMRYKDNPEASKGAMIPPGSEEKVMHMSLRIGDTRVMGSDGRCTGKPNFQGFALSYEAANGADAEQRFAALADGGKVQAPLTKTFFASHFGMVTDRFGVLWMVICER